jgi:catechol 2,3-dioxygenase-like lactoylglutathione lyase family enzyme
MLASAKLVAFVTVSNAARARAFYGDVLGLRLVSEDNFALVFDANGTMLRVAIAAHVTAAPYTVLGWESGDIEATVRELAAAGVRCERYPGMAQDELGIWQSPGGARVAWFKDPDGNTLSVSQH